MHICSFANGVYELSIFGETILFEWSEIFGPLPITKTGRERKLRNAHPFWSAVSLWAIQGKQSDGSRAVWHMPKQPVVKHIAGKHYRLVEDGELGHEIGASLLRKQPAPGKGAGSD